MSEEAQLILASPKPMKQNCRPALNMHPSGRFLCKLYFGLASTGSLTTTAGEIILLENFFRCKFSFRMSWSKFSPVFFLVGYLSKTNYDPLSLHMSRGDWPATSCIIVGIISAFFEPFMPKTLALDITSP